MKTKRILVVAALTVAISFVAIKIYKKVRFGVKYEKIYVINLDRSPERFEKIKAQFDKQNIPFERFSAVDGKELDIIKKDNDGNIIHIKGSDFKNTLLGDYWKSKYSLNCAENLHMTNIQLTPGEIGCFCSHLKIFEDIVKNNYSAAVVFEDDVILDDNFKQKLDEVLANTPKDFDMLYLDAWVDNPKKTTHKLWFNNKIKKIKRKTPTSGTYAYVISQRHARIFLMNLVMLNNPIDNVFFNKNKNQYISTEKFVDVILEDSEIYKMGRNH